MAPKKNPRLPLDPTMQWMICREPGHGVYSNEPNPKKLYDDVGSARYDAEQLSKQQGVRFYLLKVVAFVEPASPPMRWVGENEV